MSAPSSSFHDYLPTDSYSTKMEAMTPVLQTNEEYLGDTYDNSNMNNNNNSRNNRNSVIKRPMNAFLLWARGERKRVSSDGYGVSQTSLSKLLGETWRHMSVEEKQPFLDMAETLKRQHHIDHPDYKFKPKQRSSATTTISTTTTAVASSNKSSTAIKKNHSYTSQQHYSSVMPSPTSCTSSSSSSQSPTVSAAPHPVQSNVLAMCQAIIPSTSEDNNDWFYQLTGQPQSVIIAPIPRVQTSPLSSRRAVRIQIINKHDDIALPPPTLLPMTPPPPGSSSTLVMDESTPTLVDYLGNNCNIFNIPNNNYQQVLAPVLDDTNEYETLNDSSINHLTDLDQHYDSNGWIDTPLSSFGTNSTDIVPSSPYSTYDFLCL